MLSVFLIVGLGNPGKVYKETRHNLGFMVLESLTDSWGLKFKKGKGPFSVAEGRVESHRVILAEPLTYMNRSGIAIGLLVHKWSMELSNLLVVCDDLHLPLGRIRVRRSGSDGGHKGLASIIGTLRSDDFPRLRIGIGKDPQMETSDYVLSRFRANERSVVREMVEQSSHAVLDFITRGIDETMNLYNRQLD